MELLLVEDGVGCSNIVPLELLLVRLRIVSSVHSYVADIDLSRGVG